VRSSTFLLHAAQVGLNSTNNHHHNNNHSPLHPLSLFLSFFNWLLFSVALWVDLPSRPISVVLSSSRPSSAVLTVVIRHVDLNGHHHAPKQCGPVCRPSPADAIPRRYLPLFHHSLLDGVAQIELEATCSSYPHPHYYHPLLYHPDATAAAAATPERFLHDPSSPNRQRDRCGRRRSCRCSSSRRILFFLLNRPARLEHLLPAAQDAPTAAADFQRGGCPRGWRGRSSVSEHGSGRECRGQDPARPVCDAGTHDV